MRFPPDKKTYMLAGTAGHFVGFDGLVDNTNGDLVLHEAQCSCEAAGTSPNLSNSYSGEMQHSQSGIWYVRQGQGGQ